MKRALTILAIVALAVFLLMVLPGCSLYTVEQTHYKGESPNKPRQEELSFKSKQEMSRAATLMNKLSAEAYYKGLDPESRQGKALYDVSFAFMDLAGVMMGVDPENLEDVANVLTGAKKALEEKDAKIHQLQIDVDKFRDQTIKITKDKEAELKAQDGKWKIKMGSLWWWIKAIVIGGILIVIILGVVQAWTGIPILTAVFGGAKMLFKAMKQTMTGLQVVRENLKKMKATGEAPLTPGEMLDMLDGELGEKQDESVKKWIKRAKAKAKLLKT